MLVYLTSFTVFSEDIKKKVLKNNNDQSTIPVNQVIKNSGLTANIISFSHDEAQMILVAYV